VDIRSLTDDFYINMNLNTEMDLPSGRETVLHFFEQVRKRYPNMRNFYARDRNEFVLEEDKDGGNYRWTSVEPKRILSGQVNPTSFEEAVDQHCFVLEQVPYTLSISPLDCESLNVMYGFDFTYSGNHNQLIAEALGLPPAFERIVQDQEHRIIGFEPAIQASLDDDCRTQFRLSIETRTSAYHVRTGEFPEEQLSVYLTIRRFGSLDESDTYVSAFRKLQDQATALIERHVVGNILEPLKQAITIR